MNIRNCPIQLASTHRYKHMMEEEELTYDVCLSPISSMKRTAGAAALARLKSSATALSESPTYGEKTEAADADRKAEPVPEAAARTSFVLPQPGGPYSRHPLEQSRTEGCSIKRVFVLDLVKVFVLDLN